MADVQRQLQRAKAPAGSAVAFEITGAAPRTVRIAVADRAGLVEAFDGGDEAADVIGRIIATRLSTALGQQVVVENRGGAGGNLGADAVAKAKNDGYTILMGAITSHSTMATLEKGRISYDLQKDLTAVQIVGFVPLTLSRGAARRQR